MPTVKWSFIWIGLRRRQVVVNGLDHRGREFLGGETVTSADGFRRELQRSVAQLDSFVNRVDHVKIERLSAGASFLGAIEDGNLAHGWGKRFEESLDGERAIEADFQQANFLAALVQIVHRLVGGFCAGAHHDDHALGIGRAHVVEQVIGTPHDLRKLVHDCLDFVRAGVVERIAGFARLKEDVGILRGAAQHRMVGRKRALPMLDDAIHVDEGAHVVFGEHLDFVDFMRSAEAVEEMQERDAGFERGGMRDERQVHGLLHGVRREHGESRGPAEHHVGVVAENREGVGGNRARADVKRRRRKFARDLVHVGDHQQQALRRGEGRGQGSGLERAMDRSGGAAFALHFDHVGHGAPDVGHSFRRPLVRPFAHVRRRRDGINGDDFIEAVGDIRDGLVAVHGLELALHDIPF